MHGLRHRLATARGPLLGTVVTLPDVALAELTAGVTDFVWIDLEHGALSARDVQPLSVAARAAGAAALVRLRSPGDPSLGPALDAGVDGVVVPRVERASEAESVVQRLRRPPRGARGIAARRATAYGARDAASLPDPVCVLQIESLAAVRGAESIAAVDGVDALVVGCADLAADMEDDPGAAELRASLDTVRGACAAAGIAFGVAGPDDPNALAEIAGPGAGLLVLGADVRIYAGALRAAFGRLERMAGPETPEPEEAHVCA